MIEQLLHSLDGVEMFHEPPTLYTLVPLIGEVNEREWRLLFETTLYEALLDALAGRYVNFNRHDDSYIHKAKSEENIAARLASAHRHAELVELARHHVVAFKIPEMVPYVGALRSYYGGMRVVVTVRQPEAVVASLLRKGWYADSRLRGESNKWPLKRRPDVNLPFWVPDEYDERWITMNEVERCCLSYAFQYEGLVDRREVAVVDYDNFVANPRPAFAALTATLGLEHGARTETLLANVVAAPSPPDILSGDVDPAIVRRVRRTYEETRSADLCSAAQK